MIRDDIALLVMGMKSIKMLSLVSSLRFLPFGIFPKGNFSAPQNLSIFVELKNSFVSAQREKAFQHLLIHTNKKVCSANLNNLKAIGKIMIVNHQKDSDRNFFFIHFAPFPFSNKPLNADNKFFIYLCIYSIICIKEEIYLLINWLLHMMSRVSLHSRENPFN